MATVSGSGRHLAAIVGRPGSGKSSAVEVLREMDAVRLVRVSALLRDEAARGTEEGREVSRRMERGEMAATDVVARVVEEAVKQSEAPLVVLDGFPRTMEQVDPLFAIARAAGRKVSLVVTLALPRSAAEKRLMGRRVCSECGTVYNIHYDPPPEDPCAECGGRLERREDDRPEVVRARQERFERETRPVIRWFARHRPTVLRCVRAGGSVEEVRRELVRSLHERHPATVPDRPPTAREVGSSQQYSTEGEDQ